MENQILYNIALQQDLYEILITKIQDIILINNKESNITEINIIIDNDNTIIYKYIKYEYAVNDISLLKLLKNQLKNI